MTDKQFDTSNKQMVGVQGDNIVILAPQMKMTKEEALVHAAWIVILADDDDTFGLALEQVQNT